MSNIVIFGAPHSGKTTLLGYLSTAMIRHPQLNDEILERFKLIKKLGMSDDFNIGDPYNPIHVHKDIILPSFVSLDRDELRKFSNKKETTIGGSKRLHYKQLTICVSERGEMWRGQNENENISCTFIDLPGFRQKISDKYKGFFQGDIGLAVLDIAEVLKLEYELKCVSSNERNLEIIEKQKRKLFEPIRIWCDYRSSEHLLVVLSKTDQELIHNDKNVGICNRINIIDKAIKCIREHIKMYERENIIPIVPISIKITQEENKKIRPRMKQFFHREEENIYANLGEINWPVRGTLISCLRKILPPYIKGKERVFYMASVNRPMRAIVNNTQKTALHIRTIHGTLHRTDIVFLGPILDKQTNEICYVRCSMASLKADGAKETCDMLLEGNVGGVIFDSISSFEGRISNKYELSSIKTKSNICILRSTILFTGKVIQGNIVVLDIYKKEYLTINGDVDEIYENILKMIMPNDEMILFWYGQKIIVKVIEIHFSEDKLRLSVIIADCQKKVAPHFVLPCDENGNLRYNDNVLIAIPDTNYIMETQSKEITYTYISACIRNVINIEDYNFIEIKGSVYMQLENILRGSLSLKTEKKSEQDFVTISIKSSKKKYSLKAVMVNIGRGFRKNINRSIFKMLGGVEMNLVRENNQ